MRVNLAYYTDTRIDFASGHQQVTQALIDRVEQVAYLEPCLPRALPEWLIRRLGPPLGAHPRMPFYERSALPLEYGVMRKLATSPGEVVHLFRGETHFNHAAWLRFWPRRRRGALVVRFTQPPEKFEEVWRFRRKRARLRAIDWITVQSRPGLDHFRELGVERVTVVPVPVNRRVFNPPAERLPRDEVRCITVGSWLRDPLLLRAAIERVRAHTERVTFTVLAQQPSFRESVGERPGVTLGSGVHGDDLVAAYHDADILVHPAALFSGSTALNEGMACGLPVVVPDVGGVRDYVDEDCAELVPPNDPDAMADAILRLAGDPARRARMGAHSEERNRQLDFPLIAEQYVRIYEQALARRA
jgi:glycosyltransferase involved in cell wall biosynthesis